MKGNTMRKYLSLLFCLLLTSPAMANWDGKNFSGTKIMFFNVGDCTSVACVPIAAPVDGTGALFGVTGNPFFVTFPSTPTFNCGTGCTSTAGTFNNNSDGVATSSANGQAAAWLYGWNGASWDRVRTDTTNGVWVNIKSSVLPTGAATSANQASQITQETATAAALGTTADAPASVPTTTSPASGVSLWKAFINLFTNGTDTAYNGSGSATVYGYFKGLYSALTGASTCLAGTTATTQSAATTGTVTKLQCDLNGNPWLPPSQLPQPGTPTGNIAASGSPTAVVIKASAGTVYGVQLGGIGSAPAYLKLYNAASATCGSGTPVKRLIIPANTTAANGAGSNVTFGTAGLNFTTGITYCVTTGIADNDATGPAANTFLINLDWN